MRHCEIFVRVFLHVALGNAPLRGICAESPCPMPLYGLLAMSPCVVAQVRCGTYRSGIGKNYGFCICDRIGVSIRAFRYIPISAAYVCGHDDKRRQSQENDGPELQNVEIFVSLSELRYSGRPKCEQICVYPRFCVYLVLPQMLRPGELRADSLLLLAYAYPRLR